MLVAKQKQYTMNPKIIIVILGAIISIIEALIESKKN